MLPSNVIQPFFELTCLNFGEAINTLLSTADIEIPAQLVASAYSNQHLGHYRVGAKRLSKRPKPITITDFCNLPEAYLNHLLQPYSFVVQVKLASLFFWHRTEQSQGIISKLCDCYYDQPKMAREPPEQQVFRALSILKFPKPMLAIHYSQLGSTQARVPAYDYDQLDD